MSSDQKIIFIGHMNSSKNIEKILKIKFNDLDMKYGWLGNYLLLDVDHDMLNEEELEKFESF